MKKENEPYYFCEAKFKDQKPFESIDIKLPPEIIIGRYNRGYKSYERTMLIHYLANHKDKSCLFVCKTLYTCEKIELELEQNYIDYDTEYKEEADYYQIFVNKR